MARVNGLVCLLLLFPSFLMAQEISVTVDRNPVEVNQPFRITFEFKDISVDFKGPPKVVGLRYINGPSTSSNTQIVNGSMSTSRSYTYTASVQRLGRMTIPSFSYNTKEGRLSTKPVVLNVVKAGTAKAGTQSQFEAVIEVDKREVHLGEPVRVQYRIYNRLEGVNFRNYSFPELSGAWKETVKGDEPRWENTVIQGQRFQFATLRTDLIYPTQTGELLLEGFEVNAQARISFFNTRPLSATAKPVTILVNPLPGTAPAPSLGTFGNLKIRWFSEGGNAQKVNEAVNLTMEVNGSGNLGLIGEPEIEWPSDLETFDPEIKDRIRTDVNGQKGKRSFTYLVIPRSEGQFEVTLPPLSYFDFEKDRYVRLSVPAVSLNIESGESADGPAFGFNSKSDVTILTRDVRFIRTETELRPQTGSFFGGWTHRFFWGLPPLAFLLLVGLKRKRDQSDLDPLNAQKKMASRKMKGALSQARSGDLDLDALGEAVHSFLQAKLGLSRSESDRTRYSEILKNRGDEKLEGMWMDIIDVLDRGRYAPGAPEAKDLAQNIEAALKALDAKSVKKPSGTMSAMWLLLGCAWSTAVMAAPDPSAAMAIFQQGNLAYTEGDHTSAIEAYEKVALEWTSFELEYNLGGAHYKAGNIGPCILHYQRAKRFRPNDDDLNANLLLAQAAVTDRMEEMPEMDFAPIWRELISEERLLGWTAASLLFWLAGFLLLAVRLFSTELGTRRTLGISAPVVLLVAILLGLLSKQTHQRIVAEDGAVVMLPRVEVKNGPSENTDEPNLFVLHEGTVVKLMRSEGDWLQIRLSNGNTGWIKANGLTGI